MDIKEFNYNLEHGFVWIIAEDKKEDEKLTVQCCFIEDEGIKKIVMADCGHNWGLCAEGNEKAFKKWGENRCMKALFDCAEQNGFKLI